MRSTVRSRRRARSSATAGRSSSCARCWAARGVQRASTWPAGDLALGPDGPNALARAGRDHRAAHRSQGRTLEYRLTRAGRDLEAVVQAMGEWGVTWSFTDPRPEELDPDLLVVWMARHVDREELPWIAPSSSSTFAIRRSAIGWCSSPRRSRFVSSIPDSTSTSGRSTPPPSPCLPWARRAGRRDAGRKLTLSGRGCSSAASGAGLPGVRSPRPAARPTSAGGRHRDSRTREGAGRAAVAAVSSFEGVSGRGCVAHSGSQAGFHVAKSFTIFPSRMCMRLTPPVFFLALAEPVTPADRCPVARHDDILGRK